MNKEGSPPRGRRRRGRPRRSRPVAGSRPVPLHKRSFSHFQAGDRERGSQYFTEGRVELEINDTRARARVQGTEQPSYAVGLDWSRVAAKRALHVFCECQRFADGRPCKHLWATLLALGETGPGNQPPGKDRVGLRKDRASSWKDLGMTVAHDDRREHGAREHGALERGAREHGALEHGARKYGARGPNQVRSPRRNPRPTRGRRKDAVEVANLWRSQIASLRLEIGKASKDPGEETTVPPYATSNLRFLINTSTAPEEGGIVLDLFGPRRGSREGSFELQRASVDAVVLDTLLRSVHNGDGDERELAVVTALPAQPPSRRGRPIRGPRGRSQAESTRVSSLRLPARLYTSVLPRLCAEEALGWWDGRSRNALHSLAWDAGSPWQLALRLEVTAETARLHGGLERPGENVPLSDPQMILPAPEPGGTALVVLDETLAPLDAVSARDLPWIEHLQDLGEIVIPKDDMAEALTSLFETPGLPKIEAPAELHLAEESATMRPRLILENDPASVAANPTLLATLSFLYGNLEASAEDSRPSVIDWEKGTILRRDMEGEHAALVRLLESGVRPVVLGQGHALELSPQELPFVAEPLLADGWEVEVRGTSLRAPSPPSLRLESGIDWFEISGTTDFAGDQIELRAILETISRGDRFVKLSDGSQGLLPAAWVETYGSLSQLAQDSGEEGLRFLPSQALLVDAQLALLPPINLDRAFAKLRKKLQSFDRIKPKKEPRGFRGTLREYQREGLGWLSFLRDFGLGGVLADDMGLGKTVQVLALLRTHRVPSKTTGLPSLVVAPRSLVYNWIEEAARFTPTLSFVEYRGPEREALRARLDEFDVLVTTYGTLRRDVEHLARIEFDTVILDEAQAIKNRDSQSAKASRLLNARHRLCLTGTPIENHLGELGSLFEFLNPGLLGSVSRLDALVTGRAASSQELQRVAKGIRPFILRRTKEEVLKDLPPKTEQILYCTLPPSQRELYDKLRASYQAGLLGEVEAKGVGRSAIQVLEALLRLRQVACHPGLVEPDWAEAGSAKIEALFEHVHEVLDEGHKLLIFSQFTKLLAYVRQELDEEEIPYSYLDGKTRDRGAVVERFQTDPECNIFLISLKAGGLGLNLTAAGYVFLLDPWWNPAVEAQAVDRAHRIGQTQPVFSYRLIARDTVEEKILDLQHSKRQLADAILEGGEGVSLRDLTADDLRMLLS